LRDPAYPYKVERAIVIHVDAYDWNCPQHITPRFTEQEITEAVRPLRNRLELLESENAALRAQITSAGTTS
jgi:predicted pyridoxine 5'-phosphate oxidase superfamily flavin-nucleotide-binding protein